jgi:hypothetical protein
MFLLCSFTMRARPLAGARVTEIRRNDMGRIKQRHLAAEERDRRATALGELLGESINIFCWCNRCGHNAVVPVELLVAQLGPHLPVPDVGAHMRCSGCGGKEVAARPAWPSLGQVARHHQTPEKLEAADE